MSDDITRLGALALSAEIHARRVSCVEVMLAYLARLERLNPSLNAIVSMRDPEVLLAQAREMDALAAAGREGVVAPGVLRLMADEDEPRLVLQRIEGLGS